MATLIFHSGGLGRSFTNIFRAGAKKLSPKTRRAVLLTSTAMGLYLAHRNDRALCAPAAPDLFGEDGFFKKLPSSLGMEGKKWFGEGGKGGGKGGEGGGDPTEAMIDYAFKIMSPLGFGGICGVCSAVYFKKVGSQALYVTGMAFTFLQGLAYMGYIDIDYNKVVKDASKTIDADGDGKITANDFKKIWNEFKKIMMFNLPGGSGFAAGFALGLKYC